jgi:type II secretory pathway component PulC
MASAIRTDALLVAGALALLGGCPGNSAEAEAPSTGVAEPEADEFEETNKSAARPAPPSGSLWRDEVDVTVDAGLGWFLQRLDVEPSLENGRFKGFRITKLKTPDFWQGVDLKPGDVVLSVNGMPIERDMQAYEAFQSLKTASELRVKFLRAGHTRELVYKIVDAPDRAKPLNLRDAAAD